MFGNKVFGTSFFLHRMECGDMDALFLKVGVGNDSI